MIRRPLGATLACGLLIAVTECAVYEAPDSRNAPPSAAGAGNVDSAGGGRASTSGSGGTAGVGSGGAGGAQASGGSVSPNGGHAGGFGAGGASEAAGGDASGGDGSGSAGESSGGGARTGGTGGTSGTGGKGGTAGSAGTAGSGGAGNGGGGTMPSDVLLSRGKTATSDSEQTSTPHYAADGNDGDQSTRWCAADSAVNHYWEVDLGGSFTLRSLHILWEKSAAYRFKVETSTDHSDWSLSLDQTASNTTAADQQHVLPSGTSGRYVRITVTGGLSATLWASFYEFEVFGY